MRVMLDISELGFSRWPYTILARAGNPIRKCGQYRFVREMAIGLATSDEVELTLSGGLRGETIWERFQNLDASLDYSKSDKALMEVPVAYNHFTRSLVQFLRHIAGPRANPLLRSLDSFRGHRTLEAFLTPLGQNALRQAEIFHCSSTPFPEFTSSISGLRRFLTVHDLLPVLYPKFYNLATQAEVKDMLGSLRPTDWILCVSENTRNDLCEYLPALDRSRIFVTPEAADPHLFYRCDDEEKQTAARRRYNIPDRPYILAVCHVTRIKNLDHLVRCFTDVVRQEKIDDLNLVLVGPGNVHDSPDVLNEIINSGEVRNRIILTGYVDDADLAAIYSGALMFVFPTLFEGFGLPPLEAMQCGVPVITSNTTSLPEVVGNAGILVNPRDRDQLRSNILKLYQSPALRATLSDASLAQARQFSWQRCIRQTIDAYKAALAS